MVKKLFSILILSISLYSSYKSYFDKIPSPSKSHNSKKIYVAYHVVLSTVINIRIENAPNDNFSSY